MPWPGRTQLEARLDAAEQKAQTFDQIIASLDNAGYGMAASGVRVNVHTALNQITVLACIRLLAESIGQLPITMQERGSNGQWNDVESHDALGLLYEPNDWQTKHEWISQTVVWSEAAGNGYSYKAANSRGKVMALLPVEADQVSVRQNEDWSIVYHTPRGELGPRDVFHMRNFGTSGYVGLPTVEKAREAIGLALQTEKHGAMLFKNGAQIGKVLTNPHKMSKDAIELTRREFDANYSGVDNAHRVALLTGGVDIKTLGQTGQEAQFNETRRYQKQEIATAFLIPMSMINDTEKSTTWGSGLEEISKSFVRFALNPRLCRLAARLARELLTRNERQRLRFMFDTTQIENGSFKDQMEAFRSAIDSGVLNPNECRERVGKNPREGGDEYRQPLNIGIENEDEAPNAPI